MKKNIFYKLVNFILIALLIGGLVSYFGFFSSIFWFGVFFIAVGITFITVIVDFFGKTKLYKLPLRITANITLGILLSFPLSKAATKYRRHKAMEFIQYIDQRISKEGVIPIKFSDEELDKFYIKSYHVDINNKSFTISQYADGWGWYEYSSSTKNWEYVD